jgi:hypothetical protein
VERNELSLTILNRGIGVISTIDKTIDEYTYRSHENNIDNNAEYYVNPTLGLINIKGGVSSNDLIVCSYYYESNPAQLFVSDHQNWVSEHLRSNPDVFYGKYDYSGDDTIDVNGESVITGLVPRYVEQNEYIVDYRSGTVTFNERKKISETYETGESGKVRANYSYYKNIENVYNQELTKSI